MRCTRNLRLHLALALWLAWGVAVAPGAGSAERALAPTPHTGTGPEYLPGAPSARELWRPSDPGERLHLRGRVLGTSGRPLADATVEIWQADGAGSYHPERYRTRLATDAAGEFALTTALPGQQFWVRHIHIAVSHPAHEPVATRILFRGDADLGPARDDPLAIVLEETRVGDEKAWVGAVQIVLRQPRAD